VWLTMRNWPFLAEFFQLGWVVAFSLLIPLAAGLWLDKRFQTMPLFTLVGMLIGILAATVGTVRIAQRMMARLDQQGQQEQGNNEQRTDD